jgi:hypothetical protein
VRSRVTTRRSPAVTAAVLDARDGGVKRLGDTGRCNRGGRSSGLDVLFLEDEDCGRAAGSLTGSSKKNVAPPHSLGRWPMVPPYDSMMP